MNGIKIKSYNIDNKMYISIYELNKLGFDVIWDEESREINIFRNHDKMPISKKTQNVKHYIKPKADIKVGSVIGKAVKSDIEAYFFNKLETKNVEGEVLIAIDSLEEMEINYIWDEDNRKIIINYITFSKLLDIVPNVTDKIVARRYLVKDLEHRDSYFVKLSSKMHYIYMNKDLAPKVKKIAVLDYEEVLNDNEYYSTDYIFTNEVSKDTFSHETYNDIDKYLYLFIDKDNNPIGYSVQSGLSKKDGSFGYISFELETDNLDIDIELGKNFDFLVKNWNTGYYVGSDFESNSTSGSDSHTGTCSYYKNYEVLYIKNKNCTLETQILNNDEIINVKSAKILEIK